MRSVIMVFGQDMDDVTGMSNRTHRGTFAGPNSRGRGSFMVSGTPAVVLNSLTPSGCVVALLCFALHVCMGREGWASIA